MAGSFAYNRPDERFSAGGTVTLTAGTMDSDYTAGWLVDNRPGRPVRTTGTTATFRISASSAEVGIIGVCNHNLSVNIAVSNGLTATITAGAAGANGVRLNPWASVTPTSVTALDFAISTNAANIVIGEIIAGKKRTLTLPQLKSDDRGIADYTRKVDSEFFCIPPYDPGLAARAQWKGQFLLTTSELANVVAWWESQRNGTLPSLIVPDTSVNDAWTGFLQAPQYVPLGPALWRVQLTFVEIPRSRW